jgi:UDP-2,3-diacylglucosamine pyrophosphatase LpxH
MKNPNIQKRNVEVVIISDVHLGTYGCRAKELLMYLRSINPGMLILNGDIIDVWQFRKNYFPKSHIQVIKYVTGLIAKNTRVVYVTGNHDEMMRRYANLKFGTFRLVNKFMLKIDDTKTWIFHGDVFDVTMKHSKWIAKLGSMGYDMLILLNSFINFMLVTFGKEKISFSKRIKHSVKTAVSFINRFEETAADIAISKGYQNVICGHIHQPEIREIKNEHGSVKYMNSGDWIENLSALEYNKGTWSIYSFRNDHFAKAFSEKQDHSELPGDRKIFEDLLLELSIGR